MEVLLVSLAFLLAGLLMGAMLFFGIGVAPVIARTLGQAEARLLLRALFPRYYLILGAGTALLVVLCLLDARWDAAALAALIAAGFAYARQSLMPRINALRDRALAGDAEAQAGFDQAHRHSVRLNMVQVVALAAIAYRLVTG
jgi:hypothetical protein